MPTGEPPKAVELMPAIPQTLWGGLAVANFALGGLGAGLYIVAVLAGLPDAVRLAAWLGPALVLAGFAAVAAEAGRPFRGARVLGRFRTSWMSRELWIGAAFVVLAAGEPLASVPGQRVLAAVAAAGLALAHGFILRRARGVAAWDVALMPLVFLTSALVSGLGALLTLEVVAGRPPGGWLLGTTLALLVLGALVWLALVTWSDDPHFVQATGVLREGPTAVAIVTGGYFVPFVLVALALAVPDTAAPAAALAGLAMLLAQVQAKIALLLRAGRLRPVTLARLGLERRSSS